jgi:hypothetical protein
MKGTIARGVGHPLGDDWKKIGEIQKRIEVDHKIEYP